MLRRIKKLWTYARGYQRKLAAENQKWGAHLKVEAAGDFNAWLDHPLVTAHYQQRAAIAGLHWRDWVRETLGGPAERSLDLGCGSGTNSISVFQAGATSHIEGLDISTERVAEGEQQRQALGIPGELRTADVNTMRLPPNTYDLIFSCHSYHHFLDLEHINAQVQQALTERGLFILEEFVGPTQFQWTDQQIELVRALLGSLPEELRWLRRGALKTWEGRPTPKEVVAVSPFEAIRSADILPLFKEYFEVVTVKKMGGTIQHLLYNGIMHNFHPADERANSYLRAICEIEDSLIDSEMLPSDFMLLVGRRKR